MDKKRSIGVTIFGWWFIIGGILGSLAVINPQQCIKIYGMGIFLFGITISVVTLACGVFILKLNSKARKLAIIICLIGIISVPFYIKPALKPINSLLDSEGYFRQREKMILNYLKPEHQEDALKQLEIMKEISEKKIPIFRIILLTVVLGTFFLVELIPIYFFTRPKVKEQFK